MSKQLQCALELACKLRHKFQTKNRNDKNNLSRGIDNCQQHFLYVNFYHFSTFTNNVGHVHILFEKKLIIKTCDFQPFCFLNKSNRFVTSKNENTNSPTHKFTNLKCCIKAREPFKTPFLMVCYFFFLIFKIILSLASPFKDILQHRAKIDFCFVHS